MERSTVEQIVDRVVSQALEANVSRLREELVHRVLQEIEPMLGSHSEAGATSLLKAVSSIHAGNTQREVLRALLDNAVRYSGRSALFVVKGAAATGWQGRAFHNNDAMHDFALDMSSGIAARAVQARIAVSGSASEMDARFVSQFGAPVDQNVIVLPLLLKDKVAALVYADAGIETGGKLDSAALELLVLATSAWLEVASLRRQSTKEGGDAPAVTERAEQPPVTAVASHHDPFAGHQPSHASAKPAAAPAPEPVPVAAAASASAESSAAAAAAPDPFAALSPEDGDVHRKAQRFARLLVDEIKLYNQAKVAEGRKARDLYDRLKEDIDKSRSTYQKRYGATVASSGDYFNSELVRSLAEDDLSLMGDNFRRN